MIRIHAHVGRGDAVGQALRVVLHDLKAAAFCDRVDVWDRGGEGHRGKGGEEEVGLELHGRSVGSGLKMVSTNLPWKINWMG